ncbi:hypothetical protein [Streptomyces sp. NPDC012825]|uniref:hypothetical protein n=1 Tax=Streptomyces sp. NPDC012825 TaxID=3364851 RepID=UPI00369AF04F
MDPEAGVVFARTAEGAAIALGLLKCGRIWLCPVCSAKIRHGRAQEVTKAVVSWIKAGGTAYLVTFTARHVAADRLAALMDALQGTRADADAGIKRRPGAYQRLITGSTWAGRKASAKTRHGASEGIRGRIGYVGMIRATEVTVSQTNGWHPHIHAIVLVGGALASSLDGLKVTPATLVDGKEVPKKVVAKAVVGGTFEVPAEALEEWETQWRAVWTRHLAQVDPGFRPSDTCQIPGCKCEGKGHGVDFQRLETVQDAEDLGEYLAKTQDGRDPANELTRGDLKQGRKGGMTPFQVLGRIGDLMGGMAPEDADGHGELPWLLGLWSEYEAAVSGRRAIEWTRHLRQLLGIDGGDAEEDDLDVLFELDAAGDFRDGVQIQERAWHKLTGRALDLAVVEAVEGETLDIEAVTALAVSSGSIAGAVRLMTPQEVADVYEGMLTALAERREAAAERRRQEQADPAPTPA